jgi:GYF domain 2/Rhomboid family
LYLRISALAAPHEYRVPRLIWIIIRLFTGVFWLPAWLVISFWFLKDLLFAIITASNEESGGGVAFAAHVGGGLVGMAMIGAYKGFLKFRPPPQDEAEVLLKDPPAVAQESPTVYLYEAGTESGPFTCAQITQMLALGAISAETLYWQEGMPEWRAVRELLN